MLILAAMLHLWPLQPAAPGARCYGSPLRIVDDHLPTGTGNNLSTMISDSWAFLDPKSAKPIAYLYGTYGYETPDFLGHPGTFLQFTSFASKGVREIGQMDQFALQRNDPIALTPQQLADVEQHFLDDGLVLAGCFTGPYFIRL